MEELYKMFPAIEGKISFIIGTDAFRQIEDWYETFDLGNIVPRDEVLIKKSMKDALLQNPVFTVLHENERFIHLVNRLGE